MKISAIVPTWNEELFLYRLLTVSPDINMFDEIIIADNNSLDQTVNIAKKLGCKVILGGTPAKARNEGAKASTGEILFFADADIIIPPGVIEKTIESFSDENIIALHFRLFPITTNRILLFYYSGLNFYIQVLKSFGVDQALGCFIAVKRKAFFESGGFDEVIEVGEDVEFFRRLGGFGKIKYVNNIFIYVSARRLNTENHFVFAAKCIIWSILRLLRFKTNILPYKWSTYSEYAYLAETDIVHHLSRNFSANCFKKA